MTDKTITILDDDPLKEQAPEAAETEKNPVEDDQETETTPVGLSAEDELERLRAANAELTEQVKRTSAEFQNFRRRQEEEAKRVKLRLQEDIIRSMLPILDHLDRTIAAAEQGGDGSFEALLKGVELIEKDVRKIFGDHGVAQIPAEGQPFDAALHQAVLTEETDEVPDQTIVKVLQVGYTLNERVIRPSMVTVARNG